MPTNVTIDSESDALLNDLAARSGKTRLEIIREALKRLSDEQEPGSAEPTPYDLVSDLLGVAHGGPKDLARRHKAAFRELLTRDSDD